MTEIDALIQHLRDADEAGRVLIRDKLLSACQGDAGKDVQDYLATTARQEVLEVQWELEEVLETVNPPPPPPEPEEAEEAEEAGESAPKAPPQAADLDLVYNDPRGLAVHRTKDASRWFATQVDPRTGSPQTIELRDAEISQLKMQLSGSPYWVQNPVSA